MPETIYTIMNRASYRGEYLEQTVPRDDLKLIMEAGLAAPSGCNKQTVSLIAVDDSDQLKRLRAVIQPPIGETAPAMICVLTRKIYAYKDRLFNVQDYSAAIMNMLLACEDLGYRTCWIEGHITDEDQIGKKMAGILNVPEGYELVCFLPVGVAAQQVEPVGKRPFEERAWFNSFGGAGKN
ncbi:MAG: nitroreductase family protein [Clostridiales bacterium]|nr:nitroreductase family protein [Clostridiales bacterium]